MRSSIRVVWTRRELVILLYSLFSHYFSQSFQQRVPQSDNKISPNTISPLANEVRFQGIFSPFLCWFEYRRYLDILGSNNDVDDGWNCALKKIKSKALLIRWFVWHLCSESGFSLFFSKYMLSPYSARCLFFMFPPIGLANSGRVV